MPSTEEEYRLRMFLVFVEQGKTPPQHLLDFIAEGVREHLRGGKPWPKRPGTRHALQRHENREFAFRAHALKNVAEMNFAQIETLLGTDFSESTIRNRIAAVDGMMESFKAHNADAVFYEYLWALQSLLEEYPLSAKHRAALRCEHDRIETWLYPDDVEPEVE